jgi:hypothetical protein
MPPFFNIIQTFREIYSLHLKASRLDKPPVADSPIHNHLLVNRIGAVCPTMHNRAMIRLVETVRIFRLMLDEPRLAMGLYLINSDVNN